MEDLDGKVILERLHVVATLGNWVVGLQVFVPVSFFFSFLANDHLYQCIFNNRIESWSLLREFQLIITIIVQNISHLNNS